MMFSFAVAVAILYMARAADGRAAMIKPLKGGVFFCTGVGIYVELNL